MGPSTLRRDLRQTKVHPSLVRPLLTGGIEREMAVPLVGLVMTLLLVFRLNWVTPLLAGLVVFGIFPRLRRWNRRDPQGFAVVKEHVRVSGFYRGLGEVGEARRIVGTFFGYYS